MGIAEQVLLTLSRSPGGEDRSEGVHSWEGRDPLGRLRAAFPDLATRVRGADVLDFGCGGGVQSVALAALGARSVLGVDIVRAHVAEAQSLIGHATNVAFAEAVPPGTMFDLIISQDSMEHFVDAETVLAGWRKILRNGGSVFVTFGPPWLAPYGAHMHFFTAVPWVHLLFSERTVMSARAKFRQDGAMRYENVPGGLAKMTIGKFERLVRASGFRIAMMHRSTMKGLPGGSIPGLREFLTNNVIARLE